MKLAIGERFGLLDILPLEGDILTLRTAKELSDALFPTETEIKENNLVINSATGSWRSEKIFERDYPFTETQTGFLKGILIKLNDAKKLKVSQISLYEKICENKQ
ncbi:Uncharacterised protein [Candidatus Anstonella stagnisolia]|nr:Uncharacterised protein [Candidatus Anstonella stagnisolia]